MAAKIGPGGPFLAADRFFRYRSPALSIAMPMFIPHLLTKLACNSGNKDLHCTNPPALLDKVIVAVSGQGVIPDTPFVIH